MRLKKDLTLLSKVSTVKKRSNHMEIKIRQQLTRKQAQEQGFSPIETGHEQRCLFLDTANKLYYITDDNIVTAITAYYIQATRVIGKVHN